MQHTFPIDPIVPELSQTLHEHGRAILTASPGSGKTTRVPLALLGLLPRSPELPTIPNPLPGKILVLEPRRLAARAAARYMAGLLGETVGQQVGYRVRLDTKVSSATRIELLTEGTLTRRLLTDPELSGISCVIFDEFHERSLQADLGLALCLEVAEAFRPDLRLLVMSATLDAEELARFLGNCPIIHTPGHNWPVDIRYTGYESIITPGERLDDISRKVARVIRDVLANDAGNILVFLPGQGEIKRTAELLGDLPSNTNIYPLYGDLPQCEQDAAIAPPPPGKRKVVLATDLAQTSLTIEGVRVVVDAGLIRTPRFDPTNGLSRLGTYRLTQDAADQRAGRAGRLEPGLCIRLWSQGEQLQPHARPEILDADLSSLYLNTLAWGSEPNLLAWLTPPPEAALQHAATTLLALDAACTSPSHNLRITPHGQELAKLPLHPRLAHMVLQGARLETDVSSLAACLSVLTSERDPLRKSSGQQTHADVRLRLPLITLPENKRLKNAAAQVYRQAGLNSQFRLPTAQEENFSGVLLSLAWPERIAQRRSSGSFRLASGQGAELSSHDPLADEPFLAIANLGGGVNRRIYLAAPLTREDIFRFHGKRCEEQKEVVWDSRNEAVVCRSMTRMEALILDEKPLQPSPELASQVQAALLHGIYTLGLDCLPWTEDLRQLQARVLFLRNLEDTGEQQDNPWPDLSDLALQEGLKKKTETAWLTPWLEGISRRSQFSAINLQAALHTFLPWELQQRLEIEAPKRLALPSGSRANIDYLPILRGAPPILAVKLQEMFGQTDTPLLAKGRCPLVLHLLSPAGRPLQVTSDLRHFWANTYAQVRAEMRGRYPRHPWPDNPLHAQPTSKTKKRIAAESV